MAKIWFYTARSIPWWQFDEDPQTVKLISTSRLCHCTNPMDRTGTMNQYNMAYTPIPNTDGFKKDIEQVFLERAEEIWSMDKPVILFWSGGIDSSAALVSLIETKKSHHQLIVRARPSSIDEFPEMWNELVKPIATMSESREDLFNPDVMHNNNYVKVTGECGDQLFGSDALLNKTDIMHEPWRILFDLDFVTQWWDFSDGRPLPTKELIKTWKGHIEEIIEKLIPLAPFEIKTLFDFFWWINFSQKWDSVNTRICGYWANVNDITSTISFYNTDDFQRWSIVNHDLKLQGEWNTYKQPAKDFIHKYFPCENYRKNKLKIGSLNYMMEFGAKKLTYKDWTEMWSAPNQYKLILDNGVAWKVNEEIPRSVLEDLRYT